MKNNITSIFLLLFVTLLIISCNTSLNKDEKLFRLILKTKSKIITKKFIYDVQILKTKYLQMIKSRYISTLLNFNKKQILKWKKVKYRDCPI